MRHPVTLGWNNCKHKDRLRVRSRVTERHFQIRRRVTLISADTNVNCWKKPSIWSLASETSCEKDCPFWEPRLYRSSPECFRRALLLPRLVSNGTKADKLTPAHSPKSSRPLPGRTGTCKHSDKICAMRGADSFKNLSSRSAWF